MTTNWKLQDGTDLDDYFHHGDKTQAGSAGSESNITIKLNSTGNITVPYFTVDKQGHITNYGTKTIKITTGRYGYTPCSYSCDNSCDCDNCDDCSSTA